MAAKAFFIFNGGGYAPTLSGLWVTDGTVAGTQLIFAAPLDTDAPIITLGNDLIFAGVNALDVSDGTTAGTVALIPAVNGGAAYSIQSMVTIGSRVLAATDLGEHLVVTDGTVAGTQVLAPTPLPAPVSFDFGTLYSLGNVAVFEADNVHTGSTRTVFDLWVSDGTSAGTVPIIPAGEPSAGLNPTDITVIGNKAVFSAFDSASHDGLWVTDGTAIGTFELSPSATLQAPENLLAFGARALFSAGEQLWITDGTSGGTYPLSVPLPNSSGANPNKFLAPTPLFTFGNKALLTGYDGQTHLALWVTDGTVAGTSELSTPQLAIGASVNIQPSDFYAFGNEVLFRATDTSGKVGLWVTNGTSAGTFEISPANAYLYGLLYATASATGGFAAAGNDVVFTGDDASGKVSLWMTDGTAAGTSEVPLSFTGTTYVPYPEELVSLVPQNAVTVSGAGSVPSAIAADYNKEVIAGASAGAAIFIAPGYNAVQVGDASPVTLIDGNGGVVLGGGSGNDTILSIASSVDTLQAGAGNTLMVAFNGPAVMSGNNQSGNNTYFGGPAPVTVTGGAGHDIAVLSNGGVMTTGPNGNTVFLGAGDATINSLGADTIVGGNGATTVNVEGTAGDVAFGGAGSMVFNGGSGVSTVVGLAASMTINGAAGGGLFYGGTAGNNLITSTGQATMVGGGSGDIMVVTGAVNDVADASSGAETINGAGSSGSEAFFGGFGADCLVGGTGTNVLTAGVGNMTLVGGGTTDLFVVLDGAGSNVTINGFNSAHDFVHLSGYAAGAAATALAAAQSTAAGTLISLSDGTTVTFAGVAPSALNTGLFV